MIVRRLVDGIDERLDGTSFIKRNLGKVFPDHWSFMLGELALYSFVMLLLTGTFLSLFFVASPAETVYRGPYEAMQGREVSLAYESVLRISFEVRAGLVMRQTHHWAALVFVASMTAHLVRVFFTGAFRKPRELSWILGVTLLVAGIGAGFTGYSLPDDLLSGTGLRIIYSAVLSIPVVGTWLAYLLFGGEFPSAELIPRLFVMHILLIPALITGLLSAHLALVWHQTHTQFRPKGTPEESVTGTPVWPKFALKSVGLAFVTFAVLAGLGGLVQINPVWLYGPFIPYSAPSPAQPDFYAGWLEGILRLWPNWEFHVFGHTIGELFLPAVVVPGIIFTVLAAVAVHRGTRHARHGDAPRRPAASRRAGAGRHRGGRHRVLRAADAGRVERRAREVPAGRGRHAERGAEGAAVRRAGRRGRRDVVDLPRPARRGAGRPSPARSRAEFRRNAEGGFDEVHDDAEAR